MLNKKKENEKKTRMKKRGGEEGEGKLAKAKDLGLRLGLRLGLGL